MNKELIIYRLKFDAPLHISDCRADGRVSQTTIPSDTFYAALTACLIKMGDKIDKPGDLGFRISSLFPFFQDKDTNNGEPIYFLPMPFQTKLPKLKDVGKAKDVKKVRWVDSRLYETILRGESLFDENDSMVENIQSSFLTETVLPSDIGGSKNFVKSHVVQRIVMEDRTGRRDVRPYFIDRITFSYQSGLYFIVEPSDSVPKALATLEKALNLLKIEGIGSDRSVGYGSFGYVKANLTIDVPEEANHQLSLSMLIPTKEQLPELLSTDDVAYEFVRRGGWITTENETSLRKSAVYAFLPGSVFCINDKCISSGTIVNLLPKSVSKIINHPIWRNGKAVTLPIIINKSYE